MLKYNEQHPKYSNSHMLQETITALIDKRYRDATAIFWGGSLACGIGTSTSDIDLVVVYKELPNAYREAFIHEDHPYDVFVHDMNTLRYFFEKMEIPSGIPVLMDMILSGQEITQPTEFSAEIKRLASEYLALGTAKWSEKDIKKERFIITDSLYDITAPKSKHAQMASACWLYKALGQFYLKANGKWNGSGKALARRIREEDSKLAEEFEYAFSAVFKTGNAKLLIKLVEKVLKPFDGLLWDGFRQDASSEWKIEKQEIVPTLIPATIEDYPFIQNMARFMVYDMSRTCGFISEDWWMPKDGLYECFDMKKFFNNPKYKVFIVKIGKELVGFAIVTHDDTATVDYSIEEFYIVAKYQGKGIARQVAVQLWNEHRGNWLLSVIPENLPALKFWRKIVSEFTDLQYKEEVREVDYDKDQPYRHFLIFRS